MTPGPRLLPTLSLLPLLTLFACKTQSDGSDVKVFGGEPVLESSHPAADAISRATVWVRAPAGNCSGTLVTRRIVITAAHCIQGAPSPTNIYRVQFPLLPNSVQQLKTASSMKIHSGYPGVDLASGAMPLNDLAILRLPANAPEEYKPARLLSADAQLRALKATQTQVSSRGRKVVLAGFGRLESLNPAIDFQMAELELYVADTAKGRLGWASDTSAACKDDSGGPTFVWSDDQLSLAGVSSVASCDRTWQINVNGSPQTIRILNTWSTDVRKFTPWILQQLTQAEQAALQYGNVSYTPASSERADAETIGVLDYMKQTIAGP